MYRKHPSFHFPDTPSCKVWRYLDFTKFVSMLETNALYFARIDQLGDPYEYAMPLATQKRFDHPNYERRLFPVFESFRKSVFVNCWHRNEYESAAMWRLYLKSDEGIAIQSTAERFAESFNNYTDDVFIGMVSYIDYEKDDIQGGNLFEYAVFKRMSFSHENEIRAVAVPHMDSETRRILSLDAGLHGMNIPVILDKLIESVYVAPTAATWLVELVTAVVKRYGLNVEVVQSSLAKPPY